MPNNFESSKDRLQRLPAPHPYNPQPGFEETELDVPRPRTISPRMTNVLGNPDVRKLLPHEQDILIDIYEDILKEDPGTDPALAVQLALEQLREQPMLGYRKVGSRQALADLGLKIAEWGHHAMHASHHAYHHYPKVERLLKRKDKTKKKAR